MSERLCENCFERSGEDPCPHCGWRQGQAAESALFLRPGTLLQGRFRVGRVLGHGGFGITYLGRHDVLGTKYAIKEYLPTAFAARNHNGASVTAHSGSRENYRYGLEQFVEEARTLQGIKHPNVIEVLDIFEDNDTAYMLMPYLPGQTLEQYLDDRGRIDYDPAQEILLRVMDGLRFMHSKDLLHRDVSPDNIYLTTEGHVKLLDFGSARYLLGTKTRLTRIFKVGYSPWEQYQGEGKKQGAWTDVYSAAATLYRAITGQPPPPAPERLESDPLEAPSQLGARLPQPAEQALLKALAVRPEARYQSIEAFQKDLVAKSLPPVESPPVPPDEPPDRPPGRRRPPPEREDQPPQPPAEPIGPERRTILTVSILGALALSLTWVALRQGPTPVLTKPVSPERQAPADPQPQPVASGDKHLSIGLPGLGDTISVTELQNVLSVARKHSAYIGNKIWQNEIGPNQAPESLIEWRKGENHASVGIGHFIWYPRHEAKRFEETFPDLLRTLERQGLRLPEWLPEDFACPWPTREQFLANRAGTAARELLTLLESTRPQQVEFLIHRLAQGLPRMFETLHDHESKSVAQQFRRVVTGRDEDISIAGVYALIDYVNFKGEGVNPAERYMGQGWGLLQVLEEMARTPAGSSAVRDFALSAKRVLDRRIENAPVARLQHERRWQSAWHKRLDTYEAAEVEMSKP